MPDQQLPSTSNTHDGRLWALDPDTNTYVPVALESGRIPVAVSASGGGAATIADGADVAEGATTDAKVTGDNAGTVSAKLRGLNYLLALVVNTVSNWVNVSVRDIQAGTAVIGKVGIDQTTPGTTNAVSVASLPLPSGAATLAEQQTQSASMSVLDDWDESDRAKVNPIAGQAGIAAGAGAVGATVPRVTLASDDPAVAVLGATNGAAVITDADGTIQRYLRGIVKLAITAGGWLATVQGDVAHDAADSGNPLKIGGKALAYGANPTAVTANDRSQLYTNRHGIVHVLSGHPNIITHRENYTAAQTDTSMLGTIATGTKLVVVSCTAAADKANSVDVAVRCGFGAANTPTGDGVYLSHPGIAAGGGIREAGAVSGADGEEFRVTCEVPTGGSLDVVTKYFTIES